MQLEVWKGSIKRKKEKTLKGHIFRDGGEFMLKFPVISVVLFEIEVEFYSLFNSINKS